ncbi:MAG: c-type cytochrome [Bdellovibrionales bacterium]|nr:c-type cytochrome [Bdellovibrionales bacterium]
MAHHSAKILSIIGFLSLALAYQACGRFSSGFDASYSGTDLGSTAGLADADLKSQTLSILEKNCASCHDSRNASGTALTYVNDLNLLAASSYIVKGNPSASTLYLEIINGQMPPGNPMSSANAAIIQEWILSLATTPTPTPAVSPTPTPVASATPMVSPTPKPTTTPTPTPTPTATATPSMATFTYIYNNILKPKCVNCHGSAGGYSFANYTSTLKAVVAKNPAASPLYTATNSGKMPTSGKLSAQEIKAISDWITAGALNN